MRVFKTKPFCKWAEKEGLDNDSLQKAISEMERGLNDADLGGHVYKKRVALQKRGKSGGARTIIAFELKNRAFFMYGFAKNKRANISTKELKALKLLAVHLLSYDDKTLTRALRVNELIEVGNDG